VIQPSQNTDLPHFSQLLGAREATSCKMMKRKADQGDALDSSKKRILPENDVRRRFREGLFELLDEYREKYASSKPYVAVCSS
jgi:hypothetical protein